MKRAVLVFIILIAASAIALGNGYQYAPPGLMGEIPCGPVKHGDPPPPTDDWTLMESIYCTGIAGPTGLTFDGEIFWVTNYTSSANSCIYKIDPETGANLGFIPSPDYWPCGMTWDGTYLWVHDFVVGHSQYPSIMSMCKVDPADGTVLEMLESQYTFYSAGVAWDGTYLYYGKRMNSSLPCQNFIYRLDPATGIDEMWLDMGMGGMYGLTYYDDHLWYSDPHNLMYYKINPNTGAVIDQSPAIGTEPAGMTHDDNPYICNVDNTTDYIYKMQVTAPDLDLVLTPHDPPIVIPAAGGSFMFDVSIENTTASAITADVWIDAILPSGSTVPILVRPGITFPANTTISRTDITQNVPGGAPAGDYLYVCSVGDVFGPVIDYDQFTFTKSTTDGGAGQYLEWNLSGWEEEATTVTLNPVDFSLEGAYPNPFNPTTTLRFTIPERLPISLQIYDVTGTLITTLIDGWREAGSHTLTFDASNLPSGVYFARFSSGDLQQTQKLLLIK